MPRCRRLDARGPFGPLLLAGWIGVAMSAAPARGQGLAARQVTLFGILATPGGMVVDEKLKSITPQLRKLKPGHGFKLLDVQSKRLEPGQSLAGDFGDGYKAQAELIDPLDPEGKVLLRFALERDAREMGATIVATPPNQLFFFDQPMADGTRLLVGIGVR